MVVVVFVGVMDADIYLAMILGFSRHMRKHHVCEYCGQKFIFNLDEVQVHTAECAQQHQQNNQQDSTISNDSSANSNNNNNIFFPSLPLLSNNDRQPEEQTTTTDNNNNNSSNAPQPTNRIRYFCDICNKTLLFTPTEILKHKKTHITTPQQQ